MKHPYAVSNRLSPDLQRVVAYWKGLLRGEAEMPFWDDLDLTNLPDLKGRLFLIDVFDKPERFRFALVGRELAAEGLAGEFIDETDLSFPFDFLRSQASATVESAQPTCFRRQHETGAGAERSYDRLLLPAWGDGRISMLLGAVDFI